MTFHQHRRGQQGERRGPDAAGDFKVQQLAEGPVRLVAEESTELTVRFAPTGRAGLGRADVLKGGAGADRLYGRDARDLLKAKDGESGNGLTNGGSGGDACAKDPEDSSRSCP